MFHWWSAAHVRAAEPAEPIGDPTMTMTTHHLGHGPGRARLVATAVGTGSTHVTRNWRGVSSAPAFLGRGTTGLAAFATNAYMANPTTQPCADTMIKRTARSLGTRST
jgi:hypothetical protein